MRRMPQIVGRELRGTSEPSTRRRRAHVAVATVVWGFLGAVVVPGAVSAGAVVRPTTLTYCSPAGNALKMDFYRPAFPGKVPVVVEVHSGGWRSYNRKRDITPALVEGFLKGNSGVAAMNQLLG